MHCFCFGASQERPVLEIPSPALPFAPDLGRCSLDLCTAREREIQDVARADSGCYPCDRRPVQITRPVAGALAGPFLSPSELCVGERRGGEGRGGGDARDNAAVHATDGIGIVEYRIAANAS